MWGYCSFLLGPGAHKLLFVPSKSLFSQSCVSSGSSLVGLIVTSSKRAYARPRSAAPRASVPAAVHCRPVSPQEILKHSSVSVSVGSLGPGMFEPSEGLWQVWGLILNVISPPLPSCWGFSFDLGCGVSLGRWFVSSSKEEANVGAFLIAQLVKNLPAMQETVVQFLS